MRAIILAGILALGVSGGANAKSCRDANGKFTKCPPAATASASKADPSAGVRIATAAPVCKTGKPCGKSCIAKDKVCHKT